MASAYWVCDWAKFSLAVTFPKSANDAFGQCQGKFASAWRIAFGPSAAPTRPLLNATPKSLSNPTRVTALANELSSPTSSSLTF